MKRRSLYLLIAMVALGAALYVVGGLKRDGGVLVAPADHKNATYTIDGKQVTLRDGTAEVEAAPNSVTKITTRYFGNEARADLNNDGREDVVFLLTTDAGGSGTFYYVVAALTTPNGYAGSEAFLLGDRIAPQSTMMSSNPVHQNVVVINYADRAPGEPMTARPSVGKSMWLKLDPETLQWGEVAQDLPGEADPARMSLGMKTWVWQSALYNDGRTITPKRAGAFTLTLRSDGTFSAATDCNAVGGNYTATDTTLVFEQMMSTLMYCEGSQEKDFQDILSGTTGYHFTSKGELILDLKFDSGSAVFR